MFEHQAFEGLLCARDLCRHRRVLLQQSGKFLLVVEDILLALDETKLADIAVVRQFVKAIKIQLQTRKQLTLNRDLPVNRPSFCDKTVALSGQPDFFSFEAPVFEFQPCIRFVQL